MGLQAKIPDDRSDHLSSCSELGGDGGRTHPRQVHLSDSVNVDTPPGDCSLTIPNGAEGVAHLPPISGKGAGIDSETTPDLGCAEPLAIDAPRFLVIDFWSVVLAGVFGSTDGFEIVGAVIGFVSVAVVNVGSDGHPVSIDSVLKDLDKGVGGHPPSPDSIPVRGWVDPWFLTRKRCSWGESTNSIRRPWYKSLIRHTDNCSPALPSKTSWSREQRVTQFSGVFRSLLPPIPR